jgi:hypothetical protein
MEAFLHRSMHANVEIGRRRGETPSAGRVGWRVFRPGTRLLDERSGIRA